MWQTLGYIVGPAPKSSRVSFQLVKTPLEASTLAPLVHSSPVAVSSRTLCEADLNNNRLWSRALLMALESWLSSPGVVLGNWLGIQQNVSDNLVFIPELSARFQPIWFFMCLGYRSMGGALRTLRESGRRLSCPELADSSATCSPASLYRAVTA